MSRGIEFEEIVSHEKPLRGRRPSNKDLENPNETKVKKFLK